MKNLKVNQQALAQMLNLSQTTISRSLANHPAINSETKALVLGAAASLGYSQRIKRPSTTRENSSPAIWGVLITIPAWAKSRTETFQEVLKGISDKSSVHDSILDVFYNEPESESENRESILRRMRTAKWSGVILIYPISPSITHEIANLAACVSIIENYDHDLIDSVDVDQSEGILSLVDHLYQQGHRKIAFMSWTYRVPAPWVTHRLGSYVEGLYIHGLEFDPSLVVNARPGSKMTPAQCNESVHQLIGQGVTAVICAADHQAYQLISYLRSQGIRVPQDVSVTGFDGILPPADHRPLATVRVPNQELGRSAVHQLLRRIEQPTARRRHTMVDGEIILGESTAPPATTAYRVKNGVKEATSPEKESPGSRNGDPVLSADLVGPPRLGQSPC